MEEAIGYRFDESIFTEALKMAKEKRGMKLATATTEATPDTQEQESSTEETKVEQPKVEEPKLKELPVEKIVRLVRAGLGLHLAAKQVFQEAEIKDEYSQTATFNQALKALINQDKEIIVRDVREYAERMGITDQNELFEIASRHLKQKIYGRHEPGHAYYIDMVKMIQEGATTESAVAQGKRDFGINNIDFEAKHGPLKKSQINLRKELYSELTQQIDKATEVLMDTNA